MAAGHAFNSLGQIFAAGGDTGLIMQASGGVAGGALLAIIAGRFPNLSFDDRKRLADHVSAATQAGSVIDAASIPPGSPILSDIDQAPIAADLFGSQADGRRIRVTLEATQGADSQPVLAKLDFAVMPSVEDLIDAISDFIDRLADSDPAALERLGIDSPEQIAFDVLAIQRSY